MASCSTETPLYHIYLSLQKTYASRKLRQKKKWLDIFTPFCELGSDGNSDEDDAVNIKVREWGGLGGLGNRDPDYLPSGKDFL